MLYDYFINKKIVINDKDDIQTKIEKYIIKYHKIIGIILLIIFLIILYCHSSIPNINIKIQKGGATAVPLAATAVSSGAISATGATGVASAISSTGATSALSTGAGLAGATNIASKIDGVTEELSNIHVKGLTNSSKKMEKFKKYASEGKSITGKYFGSAADYSRRTAAVIKGYSPIFYRMLYTVAFTLIVAIVVLPSLAFLIIGIVCYFLLQKNMDYIKKL